jgi:hypothetical protein
MEEYAEFIRGHAAFADILLDRIGARSGGCGIAIVDRISIADRISIVERAK